MEELARDELAALEAAYLDERLDARAAEVQRHAEAGEVVGWQDGLMQVRLVNGGTVPARAIGSRGVGRGRVSLVRPRGAAIGFAKF